MKRTAFLLAVGFCAGLGIQVASAAGMDTGAGLKSGGSSVNGATISPISVTTSYFDGGVVGINANGLECAIGLRSTNSGTFRAICGEAMGGASAAAPYIGEAGGTWSVVASADLALTTGSGNTLTIDTGPAGTVRITGSKSIGSCTLDGASPSKCTATVRAGSVCGCYATGNTAAKAIGVAASLSTTTLTCTAANGLSDVVNYHCF